MKKQIPLIAMVLLMFCTSALAHKVIVFAWVEQGQIHVEGSFGSDRPAKNCAVTVTDLNKVLVHQGLTDTQGQYSFAIPQNLDSDLVVEINAGPGHLGHWTIPKEELGGETTAENLEKKMAEKNALEKSPSLIRIAAGIALIFGVAFAAAWIKRKKREGQNA
jgi:nickel transport protein